MSDGPVFLERQSYRLRRIMDAVRLLPFLGLVLWLVPLVWPVPSDNLPDGTMRMSTALLYIFCVWGGLVLVAFGLWWRSRGRPAPASLPTASRSPD